MNCICCISKVIDLFRTNMCEASAIAIAAFVMGMAVMLAVCKARCRCGRKPDGKQEAKCCKGAKKTEEKPFEKRKPHPAPADGSIEIYVGNLSYELTEDQLRAEFEAYGKVNSARIITNKFNGKSKGFGFVHMPNREEAEKACAALNDKEILGRNIKCNEAKNLI